MHPSQSLVAVGLVTGRVQAWAADGARALSFSLRASAAAARAVAFSECGAWLHAGDADGVLLGVDVATGVEEGGGERWRVGASTPFLNNPAPPSPGKPTGRLAGAHADAISRLAPAAGVGAPPGAVLAGDDAGGLALHDPRSPAPALSLPAAHDGAVNDVIAVPGTRCIASAGGDGVLRVFDLAATKHPRSASDPDEDELAALAIARASDHRLAAGSEGGVVSLWTWGAMAGCSDRMPLPRCKGGRPAVASLATATPAGGGAMLAACDDGTLRVVTALPNAVVGEATRAHGASAPPLQRVRAGAGGGVVATVAAACRQVALWDGDALFGLAASAPAPRGGARARRRAAAADGSDDDEGGAQRKGKATKTGAAAFFADLL